MAFMELINRIAVLTITNPQIVCPGCLLVMLLGAFAKVDKILILVLLSVPGFIVEVAYINLSHKTGENFLAGALSLFFFWPNVLPFSVFIAGIALLLRNSLQRSIHPVQSSAQKRGVGATAVALGLAITCSYYLTSQRLDYLFIFFEEPPGGNF
jgi:hypothetical protein